MASASAAPGGFGDLARAASEWLLGRPSVYGLPAAVAGLRLGETIYHRANAPRSLSRAAAVLVERVFARLDADRDGRADRAGTLGRAYRRLRRSCRWCTQ